MKSRNPHHRCKKQVATCCPANHRTNCLDSGCSKPAELAVRDNVRRNGISRILFKTAIAEPDRSCAKVVRTSSRRVSILVLEPQAETACKSSFRSSDHCFPRINRSFGMVKRKLCIAAWVLSASNILRKIIGQVRNINRFRCHIECRRSRYAEKLRKSSGRASACRSFDSPQDFRTDSRDFDRSCSCHCVFLLIPLRRRRSRLLRSISAGPGTGP